VRSFQSLLTHLATLTRNDIRYGTDPHLPTVPTLTTITQPTPPAPAPTPTPVPPPPSPDSAAVGPVILRDGSTLPPPNDQPVTKAVTSV